MLTGRLVDLLTYVMLLGLIDAIVVVEGPTLDGCRVIMGHYSAGADCSYPNSTFLSLSGRWECWWEISLPFPFLGLAVGAVLLVVRRASFLFSCVIIISHCLLFLEVW